MLIPVLVLLAVLALVTAVPAIRRRVITAPLLGLMGGILPRMSDTERTALEAGTVWWDAELFSGRPDFRKLLDFAPRPLSERERAFLDGPVEELCRMVNEWDVSCRNDLPPEAWAFIKRKGFFGLIIPEEFGGLGFSAHANSAVVTKLSTRSITAAVTVMVPNSLGPAELLLHYGTEEQKRHYLPRLARGEEIPCFALTSPEAGSDAASTKSVGVVCRGAFRGQVVLGMRLTWDKRYITLSSVATVIGLGFRLLDPERLLGGEEDLGITCALIPADLPGVEIGARHDPLGVPFLNGPTRGADVFVPLEFIIGGRAMAGQGWRMLMECLAAGRGISLPALSSGAAQLAARVAGAYATVREQFDVPIGRFEGIEEPLARIGGLSYLLNAARTLTAGAVDAGHKPAVISAMVKAYSTEGMREAVNAAMDIQAGAGISRGPRNTLAGAYAAVPIGITVEGANILTRSLIIYGQGAIRCHPYVREEMAAVAARDLARFDRAFFGHVGFVCASAWRAWWLGLTNGAAARPPVPGIAAVQLGRIARLSAAFALLSDVAMATLGGSLKRKEKLSGRFADALAWMYFASAAVKRYWDEGRPEADASLLRWSCRHALHQAEQALLGVLENLPNRPAAWLLRRIAFPVGPRNRPPDDALGGEVATALLDDREGRSRLSRDVFIPPAEEPGLGALEAALDRVVAAAPAEAKIRAAVRTRALPRRPEATLVDRALEAAVISDTERRLIDEGRAARTAAIQVDSFDPGTRQILPR
jgi:acyl-CoA dehydrogenase